MENFSKNIISLYIIKVAKWFNLVMPVVVLFYKGNNLGMTEILTLKSIYSIAIVSMEVPSGWMADIWGRKKTLLAGSILSASGFGVYSFSYGFWAFAFAEIILGFGHSFVSGADSAMLYDSLKASNRTKDYIKVEGRITSAGNFAEAFAGIFSGFLAAWSLRYPFYFQFLISLSAVPASVILVEPALHTTEHIHSLKKFMASIQKRIISNENLRISILLSAVTGTATLTFAWLVQPFFLQVGVPVEYFGIMWTLLNLTVGLSSFYTHWIEKSLGRFRASVGVIALVFAGYLLSGTFISKVGIAFLFMFYLARGIATPVFKDYINRFTDSDIRATVLSVRDFAIRINFAVVGPVLGWITDHKSLKLAFYFAGITYILSMGIIIWPWLKKRVL